MQTKQAIFIIGSPGSGKDVVIRDISSNYNIVEFAATQIDEMLSNDAAFKRALPEKQDSLLERTSILISTNSFNLNFCFGSLPPHKSVYNNITILTNYDIYNN